MIMIAAVCTGIATTPQLSALYHAQYQAVNSGTYKHALAAPATHHPKKVQSASTY